MINNELIEIRNKIVEGMKHSSEKLLKKKIATNSNIVIIQNGKIVEIPAKDIRI